MFSIAYPHHFQSCQELRRPTGSFMEDFPALLLTSHPLFHILRQKEYEKPKTWVRRVRLHGFDPEDIKLTVTEDNKLQIHARHEESKDEDSDVYQSTRILSIPENVDTKQLKSRLLDNGVLIFQAPYMTGEEKSEFKETNGEEIQVDQCQESIIPENTTGENSAEIITENDIDEGNKENVEEDKIPDSIHNTESLETKLVPIENKQLEFKNENEVTKAGDFHLNLQLQTFSPEDIRVTRKDNSLVVKAERKEENDGLKLSQYYSSEYSLPSNVDMDNLTCVKNSEGQLVISAPHRPNE